MSNPHINRSRGGRKDRPSRNDRGSKVYRSLDHSQSEAERSFIEASQGSHGKVPSASLIASKPLSEYYDTDEIYDPEIDQILSVPVKDKSITETQGLRSKGDQYEIVEIREGRLTTFVPAGHTNTDNALMDPATKQVEICKTDLPLRKKVRKEILTPRTLLSRSRDSWQGSKKGSTFVRVTSKGRRRVEVEETADKIYDPSKDRRTDILK